MRTKHLLGLFLTLFDHLLHYLFLRTNPSRFTRQPRSCFHKIRYHRHRQPTPTLPRSDPPMNACSRFHCHHYQHQFHSITTPLLSKTEDVLPQLHKFPTPITTTHPYPSPLQAPPRLLFVFLPPFHPLVLALLAMYPHLLFSSTLAPAVDPPMATFLVVQFEVRVFKISRGVVLRFLSSLFTLQ